MSLLISDAMAAAPAAAAAHQPAAANGLGSIAVFAVLILLMYFVMIRPQAKRAKEHRNLVNNLAKGDEVVTGGGMLGKIVDIVDNFVVLEIAENIQIRIQKQAIANSVPKGTIGSIK